MVQTEHVQRYPGSAFNFTLCSMLGDESIVFLLEPCPQLNILRNKLIKYFHIRICIGFLWKQLPPIAGNTSFFILTYWLHLLWLCGHQEASPLRLFSHRGIGPLPWYDVIAVSVEN